MHKQMLVATPLGDVMIEATANGVVLLAKGELPRSIYNGMTIDGSTACVLTVQPNARSTGVLFSASLKNPEIRGYPSCGEHLDCIEFTNDDWHLTFGTEDQEMLDTRLPGLNIKQHPYPVDYSPLKMTLQLDTLAMKGESTFHMIISYKALPDEREDSAWFFADTPHELALEAVKPYQV